MQESSRTYIPAAGSDWLLPLYDPLAALLGVGAARRVLVNQAAIQPGQRVLDIGCGTGTLVTLIKQLYPDVEVVGLDPDPKALARARSRAQRAAVSVNLDQGFSDELAYPDSSFDRVFSTFMFHHLERRDKEETLGEVLRILKPEGLFSLLDFAGPETREAGLLTRLFHSNHALRDNSEDQILTLMKQAGFADPKKVGQRRLGFGLMRTNYYQACSPASETDNIQL